MKGSELWRLPAEAQALRRTANTIWRQSEELLTRAQDLNDAALALEREYERLTEEAEDMAEVAAFTGGKVWPIPTMGSTERDAPETGDGTRTSVPAATAGAWTLQGESGLTSWNGLLRFRTRGRTRQLYVVR